MQERNNRKRFLASGLLDLALILATLRITDYQDVYSGVNDIYQEQFIEDGPQVGVTSLPTQHSQNSMLGGTGYSHKAANFHYDNIMDEYENIMRDLHSRPPAIFTHPSGAVDETQTERNIITMVISVNAGGHNGDVQVASNAHSIQAGAVGGTGTNMGWFEDNLDIFNNFLPSSMDEDEINNLILSSAHENSSNSGSNDNTHNDGRWQQFLAGYNSSFDTLHGSLIKRSGVDSPFNWGGQDVLSEAILSSELFSNPVMNGAEHGADTQDTVMSQSNSDIVTSSRLETVDNHEWSTQNHEEDLLFPSLPPPTYDEMMRTEATNSSSNNGNQQQQQLTTNHMHDHNYYNRSRCPDIVTTGVQQEQNTPPVVYAIRSRQEVSTRVISVLPRPRPSPEVATSEVFETMSDTSSEISIPESRQASVRRITTGSDSGVEIDCVESQREDLTSLLPSASNQYSLHDLDIRPYDSTYCKNLTKDVRLHREVILCN